MKNWKIALTLLILLIFTVSIVFGFTLQTKYKGMLHNISVEESALNAKESTPVSKDSDSENAKLDSFAFLLYGLHGNTVGREPTDTLILALIDPNNKKVSLISIPRDAYVEIPGHSPGKINSAYTLGGTSLLIDTVEIWLDIDLYAYGSVNFQGFIELVDLAGGIDVTVTRKMEYDDFDGTSINLSPGKQTLDGKNALDFVRFRMSNDGWHASDYDRMERQQLAVHSLADKLTSISAIPKLFQMMSIVEGNIQTSLTPDELGTLIRSFVSFKIDNLEKTSVLGEGYYHNGVWYERIPDNELVRIKELINQFAIN